MLGLVIELAQIQENMFEELFSTYLAKFLGEVISVQKHAAPVFAPARIQEATPVELFVYWFRTRGVFVSGSKFPRSFAHGPPK